MSAAIKPAETEKPLPNSRRIYIDGQQPGVRVPFREIDQNPTRNFRNELEENPPVRVYDTSGPYGDPSIATQRRQSFPHIRRDRKSTRLNSSHLGISYAVFCLKKKRQIN